MLDEVRFVHGDDARFPSVLDEARDLFVLRGHAHFRIDDDAAEVRPFHARLAPHDAENFHGIVHLPARADACGVDEDVAFSPAFVFHIHSVARGAADGRNHRAIRTEDGVGERRFPHIGPPDDGDFDRRFLLRPIDKFRQSALKVFDKLPDPVVVLRADAQDALKAQFLKLRRQRPVLGVVDFIHRNDDRLPGFAQLPGQHFIHRREPILRIHDEQQHIARRDGDVRLRLHLFLKRSVRIRTDAACIEDGKRRSPQPTFRTDTVASDPRLIVDNGDFAPSEAIEKSGLPDVWASYDSNSA